MIKLEQLEKIKRYLALGNKLVGRERLTDEENALEDEFAAIRVSTLLLDEVYRLRDIIDTNLAQATWCEKSQSAEIMTLKENVKILEDMGRTLVKDIQRPGTRTELEQARAVICKYEAENGRLNRKFNRIADIISETE